MDEAMKLNIPMFQLIEEPIPTKKMSLNTSGQQEVVTRTSKKQKGSIEFFSNLNKEAIQILNKREKIEKSTSTNIKHFKITGSSDIEVQAQKISQQNQKNQEKKRRKRKHMLTHMAEDRLTGADCISEESASDYHTEDTKMQFNEDFEDTDMHLAKL